MDTIVGLGVLAVVGAVLTATLVRVGRGRDRLEELRSASRLLESAGAEIGAGRALPAGVKAEEIAGPDGARWVRLTIDRRETPSEARGPIRLTLVVPAARGATPTEGAPGR